MKNLIPATALNFNPGSLLVQENTGKLFMVMGNSGKELLLARTIVYDGSDTLEIGVLIDDYIVVAQTKDGLFILQETIFIDINNEEELQKWDVKRFEHTHIHEKLI